MSLPIARILHFNFETAEDLNLWVMKYETETSELAKEAIQRTLVKTDETSLVICNIYHNEEDANNVLERLSKWSGTVKATRTWESFNLTSEVVIQRLDYGVGQGYWANTSEVPNDVTVSVDVYAVQE